MSDNSDYWQIQCAECLCTLYYTDGSVSGINGELCSICESELEASQVDAGLQGPRLVSGNDNLNPFNIIPSLNGRNINSLNDSEAAVFAILVEQSAAFDLLIDLVCETPSITLPTTFSNDTDRAPKEIILIRKRSELNR